MKRKAWQLIVSMSIATFFVLYSLFSTTKVVFAANDCAMAETFPNASNPATLDARVCIGGFNSKAEAGKPLEVTVFCSGKSGWGGGSTTPCYDLANQSKIVTADNNNILPDDSGKYYTCFDVQQINRDVGEVFVTFKDRGSQICATQTYNTVPSTYNWQERVWRSVAPRVGLAPGDNVSGGQNIFCSKNGKQGILTALGCIVVEGTDFVTTLLNFGIGIAGGIAFLLIIFGGFQILTSAGNPERLNEGKELISSAITGLLMIVFSVFLLRIIGVDILGIPSFK